MARINPPGYTQVPNVVFENMGAMGNAELKVVLAIVRKTFGWQKKVDRISLSQLETMTGLSRQGVIDGTAQAIENGWIEKTEAGNSFDYSLIVNEVDQSGSQVTRPEVVKQVDSLLVKQVDTQKKQLKKSKETIISRKREPTPRNPDLLITSIKHGEELQNEFRKAYESMNRNPPLYFENILQKEAFNSCAESLNGKFMEAVKNTLQRGRISRGDLLSSLKAWVRNELHPQRGYSPTNQPRSFNAVVEFLEESGAFNGR